MHANAKFRDLLLWASQAPGLGRAEIERYLGTNLLASGGSAVFRFFERDVPDHGCRVEWREAVGGEHRILILRATPPLEETEAGVSTYGAVQDRQMFPRVPPSGVVAYSIETTGGRPGGIQYDSTGSRLMVARVEFGSGTTEST